MTCDVDYECLPSSEKLLEAPERAHLAVLRVAVVISNRALRLEHGQLNDLLPPAELIQHTTLTIAALLLSKLEDLDTTLGLYEAALKHAFRLPGQATCDFDVF